ncbi:MAG: hypothetical protein ACE5DM_03580 [Candidatus Nanoarchaeia archaeon]
MGYGWEGMTWTWGLVKVLMFVIATFVFSVIFWSTKKWIENVKCCSVAHKKKR